MTSASENSSFDKLKNFLSQASAIPPLEWLQFARHLRLTHLKKGQHLFHEGEKSDMIGFVTKGVIHTYFNTDDGKVRTKNFAWEGRLISPYVSILQNLPANFSAEALEPCLIVHLSGENLKLLQKRHPCWETITKKCTELILIEREKREFESLTMSYENRINAFNECYKPILDRIPQYLIASYLGITPVALSRINNKYKELS